jgi:hypothetical protein
MAKKFKLIPFGWLPGHWGLVGELKDRALIEYYYDGYDKEILLLDLKKPSKEIEKEKLNVKHQYQLIDSYEYQQGIIDIETADDPVKNQLAKLKLDYDQGRLTAHQYMLKSAEIEHGTESDEYKIEILKQQRDLLEISQFEFEKKVATLLDQPWIKVVTSSYEPEMGIDGFTFELDYNAVFVRFLKENGYIGLNDDDIVESWFNDVSKTELEAELENDFTIPKTKISSEAIKTKDGKEVKRFS